MLKAHARLAHLLLPFTVAQLRVLAPNKLVIHFTETGGMIHGSTAPFGAPSYGEKILGELRPGADDCKPLKGKVTQHKHTSGERLIDIQVVHRSDRCSFVRQVLVAEQSGAGALIVLDKDNATKTQQELEEEVIRDDGKGWTVKIPSMLIRYVDGSKLYNVASRSGVNEGSVIVEMSWDVPEARFVVADFWMSSGSRESQNFMKEFRESAQILKYHLDFIPHYHVWSPSSFRERGDMCLQSKDDTWHCAPDPDGFGPLNGADVLEEDVRQLCLWFLTSKRDTQAGGKYSEAFWEYVYRFPDECPLDSKNPLTRFGERCSLKLMSVILDGPHSEVSSDKVRTCANEQAGNFLNEQVTRVAWSPQALRINGWRYRGALDPQTVVRAVCSGFSRHVAECDELTASSFWHRQILQTKRTVDAYFSDDTFYILVFLIFIMAGINMYLYRRGLKRMVNRLMRDEVMLEVRSQMYKSRESDYARF